MTMLFEDNWVTQTNWNENIAAVLASLCKIYDLKISKKTIFETHSGGELMANFNEVERFCNNWGIECRTIGFEKDLENEFLPAFVLTCEYRTQLVMKIEEDSVFYIDGVTGWVEKSKDEFFSTTMGYATLVLSLDNYKPEADFDKNTSEDFGRIGKIRDEFGLKVVENFMSVEECDLLISKGENFFERSLVAANGEGALSVESDVRTSSSAFLDYKDDFFDKIRERGSALINVNKEKFESLQLTSYSKGQQYEVHTDAFRKDETEFLKDGQRTHTILVYLTDDYQGGGTIFPYLDLIVKPSKGRAVVWSSLNEDHQINPYGLHGGLPVQSGRKTICNLWVRDQDQINWT